MGKSGKDRGAAEENIRSRDIARTHTKAGKDVPKTVRESIKNTDNKLKGK